MGGDDDGRCASINAREAVIRCNGKGGTFGCLVRIDAARAAF